MVTVGIRELRQDASELVRRAEAGEAITIAVSGRPAAQLTPLPRRQWVPGSEVSEILSHNFDPTWADDLAALRAESDDELIDPWTGKPA